MNFLFLPFLLDFYYCALPSKPPRLDFCTPIISPSCKVTAQQSTRCFPLSVDQINAHCRLAYGVLRTPKVRASWASYPPLGHGRTQMKRQTQILDIKLNIHCYHGRLPLLTPRTPNNLRESSLSTRAGRSPPPRYSVQRRVQMTRVAEYKK